MIRMLERCGRSDARSGLKDGGIGRHDDDTFEFGNAIVPHQFYPIFEAIAKIEMGDLLEDEE